MPFNTTIVDYGMGNLKSIYKCFKHLNIEAIISDNSKVILNADGVILPGVGAFKDAIKNLEKKQLIDILYQVVDEGKPLFGICLGLQLLLSKSYEMGETNGIDLIEGIVVAFDKEDVDKIPQIGWNNVQFQNFNHFLVKEIPDNSFFYFVHSYYVIPKNNENILGLTKYGNIEFSSIISKDNIVGTQFHPEKSSENGIKMYQNFINFCKK
jgi:glutamine amidotransferase